MQKLKNFVVELERESMLEDVLHADGSKTYQLGNGGSITLKNKQAVSVVENILNSGFTGWGYMPLLTGFKENGIITHEEYLDICKILD